MTGAWNGRTFPQSVFDTNAEWYPAWRRALPRPEPCGPTACRFRPTFPDSRNRDVKCELRMQFSAARYSFCSSTPDSPAPLRMPADVPTCRPLPFGQSIMADIGSRPSILTARPHFTISVEVRQLGTLVRRGQTRPRALHYLASINTARFSMVRPSATSTMYFFDISPRPMSCVNRRSVPFSFQMCVTLTEDSARRPDLT